MEQYFSSESIGFLTAALLILGVSKLILYYKSFNVSILRYIDPSEIIILFADNVVVAGPIILALLAPYVYSMLPYSGFVNGSSRTQTR